MRKLIFIFFLLLGVNSWSHKYYVSISNMAWDEQESSINVSLKATDHDFLHMLEMTFNKRLDLSMIADTSQYARFMEKYVNENFVITSGGKQAKMEYLGFELSNRLNIYFYFMFKEIENPKVIDIENKFLFESFPKQQNIIHYKYKDSTKSVTLLPSQPKGTILFY